MTATDRSDLLIVGASQAGVQLAVSLRELGYPGSITLLGDEDHRPYQRPALSKEYLLDKVEADGVVFRSNEFWADRDIRLVRGEHVLEIERDAAGGVARTSTGATHAFGRLALAVGARARTLDTPGIDLDGVQTLRTADDAIALKARLGGLRDAVVIGGGFIGLEAAASLHQLGVNVTVLEYGPRLIGRAVGEETAGYFLERHLERGLDIRLDARITRIVPDERGSRVAGVELEDGEVVPAQLVLVGVGVVPNVELAAALGLEIDNGVVVDAAGVASDGVTIAVGDVANRPDPTPGGDATNRIRLESVNNAIEHAKAAAAALAGADHAPTFVPWFWSNQADLKLQIAGLNTGHDRTVVRHDPVKGKHSVLYYRGDRIVAADCVNAPLDFMAVRTALGRGQNIPAEAAADVAVHLKTLVQEVAS